MTILTNALLEHVTSLFPGYTLSPYAGFWPMPSLSAGELSSSAAIELARATKQNAEQIAEKLIERLAAEVGGEWRNDRGYVVVSGTSRDVLLSQVMADVPQALEKLRGETRRGSRRVWCLIPDNTAPVYARIRLVARASMQALLTLVYSGECLLRLYPADEMRVVSIGQLTGAFRDAVRRILETEGEVRLEAAFPEFLDEDRMTTVWTTHHYHERLAPEIRHAFASARKNSKVAIVMPADGWLLSRDRGLPELLQVTALRKVIERLDSIDAWYSFLFHASGTVPSGDFDPAVVLFEESASPLWNLRALVDRYRRLWPKQELPVAKGSIEGFLDSIPEPRDQIVRPLLLSSYCARAIVLGELGPWSEAIEKVAQRGHVFMNAPETRRALDQGDLNSNSGKIAAGLALGLSCILPLVMEETCEDQ